MESQESSLLGLLGLCASLQPKGAMLCRLISTQSIRLNKIPPSKTLRFIPCGDSWSSALQPLKSQPRTPHFWRPSRKQHFHLHLSHSDSNQPQILPTPTIPTCPENPRLPSINQPHNMPSADRSPSPPPSAPTASTPGPRASAFITLYNNALSNTLKSISYESFAACFPLIAQQAPDSLRAMHGAFVGRLEGFAKVRFLFVFGGGDFEGGGFEGWD